MKDFILGMFKTDTNKTNYKTELIYLMLIIILSFVEAELTTLLPGDIDHILWCICVLKTVCLLILLIIRCIAISYNKDQLKFKEGKFNFKYDSCMYSLTDIFMWIEKAVEPDTIIVKSKGKQIHVIDIQFEVKGRVGPFINKTTYFNDEEFDVEGIKKTILDECLIIDDKLEVLFYTENNDPKLFQKVIDQLK